MYKAFSDGGCKGNPGPGGWGCVVEHDSGIVEKRGGMNHTTNNQMELTGAIEALKATPLNAQVLLTTDSQYVIKGMTEWINGWKRRDWKSSTGGEVKNKELWVLLDAEVSTRKVTWEWVRGHTGHPQNERCDELANQAIAELSVAIPVQTVNVPKTKVVSGSDPALGIDAEFNL